MQRFAETTFFGTGRNDIYTGTVSVKQYVTGSLLSKEGSILGQFKPSNISSSLYHMLCKRVQGGACTFPRRVVLNETLDCNGDECKMEYLRVVKMFDQFSGKTVYYTYNRRSCVHLTFFSNGKVTGKAGTNPLQSQCANPNSTAAQVTCCDSNNNINGKHNINGKQGLSATQLNERCMFVGEKMTYDTAVSRCEQAGLSVCAMKYDDWTDWNGGGAWKAWGFTCDRYARSWLSDPCQVKVQVDASGLVNIYDPINTDHDPISKSRILNFKTNSKNQFHVNWNNNAPRATNGCGDGCVIESTTTCLCDIVIENLPVISNFSSISSKEEFESQLSVGALDPNSLPIGEYNLCTSNLCKNSAMPNVNVYFQSGTSSFTTGTIF